MTKRKNMSNIKEKESLTKEQERIRVMQQKLELYRNIINDPNRMVSEVWARRNILGEELLLS